MPPSLSRRGFVAALAAAPFAVQDTVPEGPAGRLYNPSWAGRSRDPVTAAETDAAIQAIEKRLKCTCGCNLDVYTCRTTDFTCEVSPAMHREVVALADRGVGPDEIVADFVRRHGVTVLMAPPKRGFNLAGYWVPGLAILLAAGALLLVLRRWTRAAGPAADAGPIALPDVSSAELERVRRELEQFPG